VLPATLCAQFCIVRVGDLHSVTLRLGYGVRAARGSLRIVGAAARVVLRTRARARERRESRAKRCIC